MLTEFTFALSLTVEIVVKASTLDQAMELVNTLLSEIQEIPQWQHVCTNVLEMVVD